MSEDKRPKTIIDLKKYDDPTDLSPKNLEWGLWIATHQKKIYKILIIILASIAASFLLYAGYGYFYYFVFGQEEDRTLDQSIAAVNSVAYRLQNKPIDLAYSQAQVISSNTGSDFVVHLKNANDKQSATFAYCFVAGTEKACGNSFILPSEEKNLVLINSTIKAPSGSATFELSNINWQKLKAGDIPNWDNYRTQRSNFVITAPKFSTYGNNVNYLEFDITNDSSYGYFEVPLNIIMSRGNEIMAINRYIVKDLNSRETKSIRLSWPEAVNLGGSISITPDLNLLDSNIYKAYTSN